MRTSVLYKLLSQYLIQITNGLDKDILIMMKNGSYFTINCLNTHFPDSRLRLISYDKHETILFEINPVPNQNFHYSTYRNIQPFEEVKSGKPHMVENINLKNEDLIFIEEMCLVFNKFIIVNYRKENNYVTLEYNKVNGIRFYGDKVKSIELEEPSFF